MPTQHATTPRVVVVIGGSSGIGLATALAHAGRRDHLVLCSRSAEALDAAAAQCRDAGAASVRTTVADVCDRAQVEQLIESTADALGDIDAVHLCAAVMAYGELERMPPEVFETMVATEIFGAANVGRAALRRFRRQGRGVLVVVNSVLGAVTVPAMGAYAAGKWGQRAVTRTLQQEVRDQPDVHVCLVSPGSINTPIYYQAATILGRPARPPWPVGQPEPLARLLVGLVDRPRRSVSFPAGPLNPLLVFGYRAVPALYDALVGPLFGRLAVESGDVADTEGSVFTPTPEGERVRGRWPEPRPA